MMRADELRASIEEDDDAVSILDEDGQQRDRVQDAWQRLAADGPDHIERRERPPLGQREVDQDEDWHAGERRFPDWKDAVDWIKRSRVASEANQDDGLPLLHPSTLSGRQRDLFDKVLAHALTNSSRRQHAEALLPPLTINIDGTAGTGKSYTIFAISRALRDLARRDGRSSTVARIAPSGVAAFNILGETIHRTFSVPVGKDFEDLPPGRLGELQQLWRHLEYIIIDEKSMVGRSMLGKIDLRLRQIFPACKDVAFGGRSVLLFGDFGQLPAILDSALYDPYPSGSKNALSGAGLHVYKTCFRAQSITLDVVHRQQGADPAAVAFRQALMEARDCQLSPDSIDLLEAREKDRLPPGQSFTLGLPSHFCSLSTLPGTFDDAPHLFSRKADVYDWNDFRLRTDGRPILKVDSINSSEKARKASTDAAGGLAKAVYLMRGAKVMLTSNLWTQGGLVNGTMGEVEEVVLGEHNDNMPAVVFVSIPTFQGLSVLLLSLPLLLLLTLSLSRSDALAARRRHLSHPSRTGQDELDRQARVPRAHPTPPRRRLRLHHPQVSRPHPRSSSRRPRGQGIRHRPHLRRHLSRQDACRPCIRWSRPVSPRLPLLAKSHLQAGPRPACTEGMGRRPVWVDVPGASGDVTCLPSHFSLSKQLAAGHSFALYGVRTSYFGWNHLPSGPADRATVESKTLLHSFDDLE